MYFVIVPLLFVAVLAIPLIFAYRYVKTGKKLGGVRKAVIINLCAFAAVCLAAVIYPLGGFAVAAATGASSISTGAGIGYIAAALSTGIACIGAGIAVSNGSVAAIGGISENPKIFGRAIIFVVLGEGIAIYGLITSFMILGKIG